MKLKFLVCSCLLTYFASAQTDSGILDYKAYWENLDSEFRDPETTPLKDSDLEAFDSIPRFAYNSDLRVSAIFKPSTRSKPFKMKTTGRINQNYIKVGVLKFALDDDSLELTAYRNLDLERSRPGEEFIFIPFTDESNGISTYGGGRYLDFSLQEEDGYIIDFNKAYNPYCAYNYEYSCPIPPAENNLNVQVLAGARSD